jgi:hypothetical protein
MLVHIHSDNVLVLEVVCHTYSLNLFTQSKFWCLGMIQHVSPNSPGIVGSHGLPYFFSWWIGNIVVVLQFL